MILQLTEDKNKTSQYKEFVQRLSDFIDVLNFSFYELLRMYTGIQNKFQNLVDILSSDITRGKTDVFFDSYKAFLEHLTIIKETYTRRKTNKEYTEEMMENVTVPNIIYTTPQKYNAPGFSGEGNVGNVSINNKVGLGEVSKKLSARDLKSRTSRTTPAFISSDWEVSVDIAMDEAKPPANIIPLCSSRINNKFELVNENYPNLNSYKTESSCTESCVSHNLNTRS